MSKQPGPTPSTDVQINADRRGIGARVKWPVLLTAALGLGVLVGKFAINDNLETKARISAIEAGTQTKSARDDAQGAEILRRLDALERGVGNLNNKFDQFLLTRKLAAVTP